MHRRPAAGGAPPTFIIGHPWDESNHDGHFVRPHRDHYRHGRHLKASSLHRCAPTWLPSRRASLTHTTHTDMAAFKAHHTDLPRMGLSQCPPPPSSSDSLLLARQRTRAARWPTSFAGTLHATGCRRGPVRHALHPASSLCRVGAAWPLSMCIIPMAAED